MTSAHTESRNHFLTYHELVMHRIVGNQTRLYDHQREAIIAIYAAAQSGKMTGADKKAAYIRAGTACGKTLIQVLTPYVLAPWMSGKQALFLSDNCTLKSRLVKDFPVSAEMSPIYDEWPIYKLSILPGGTQPPKIFVIDSSTWKQTKHFAIGADILVANRQLLINVIEKGELKTYCELGLMITDEAHFSAAETYKRIYSQYPEVPLVYFTGSRYRSDEQPLPFVDYEKIVELNDDNKEVTVHLPIADFEFTIQDAWKLAPTPIKTIAYKSALSESFLIEENDVEIEMSPDEFFYRAANDRQWLHSILLADSFCLPVLEMGLDILMRKREITSQPHSMLIRTLNIKHCHRVEEILKENFPYLIGKIGVVHSEHKEFSLDGEPTEIIQNIHDSKYWVVIHCATLGVGFDYKWFSMSLCLGVLLSMSNAEQEWGRCLRLCPGGDAPRDQIDLMHPNQAVLITHDVLNIKDLFEKYVNGTYLKKVKIEEDEEKKKRYFPPRIRLTEDYLPNSPTVVVSDTKRIIVGSELTFLIKVSHTEELEIKSTVLQIIGEKELAIDPIDQSIAKGTSILVNRGAGIESLFKEHLNLDWLILIDGKLVSYGEYINLSPGGELEIPYPAEVVRPDLVQIQLQRKYSNILKAAAAKQINKLPDKGKGNSLLELRDHDLFRYAFEKAGKHNKTFTNNTNLTLAAMFGRIRATTRKEWSEHLDDADYKGAVGIGFEFIKEFKVLKNELNGVGIV